MEHVLTPALRMSLGQLPSPQRDREALLTSVDWAVGAAFLFARGAYAEAADLAERGGEIATLVRRVCLGLLGPETGDGAVGLAAAYAFVEYFIKSPIQYAVLHRLGPVTAWDLCWHQIPLLVAAGITLAVVRYFLRGVFGMHGLPIIACALVISYVSAILITAIRPTGKAVLNESRMLIGRLWNSATRFLRQQEASA